MRYIIIYAVLNPTPKGVGYDLNVHFIYFRNSKFIAPGRWVHTNFSDEDRQDEKLNRVLKGRHFYNRRL